MWFEKFLSDKMWLNGGGDMNPMLNSAMNSTMGLNAFMNQMMPQFNANNHNVFDFSLHSSSMQQGIESSANAVPVSTQNTFCISFVPAYFVEKQFYHSRPFLKFLLIFICMHSFSSKSKKTGYSATAAT